MGRQESLGLQPPLPAALPNLQTIRNPLPAWMPPLLEAAGPSGTPGISGQPECSRGSGAWPHADLRREFRSRIGATDAGAVAWGACWVDSGAACSLTTRLDPTQVFLPRTCLPRTCCTDYVVLLVGTHAEHKGTARLVGAFARAWWRAGVLPAGDGAESGRLLLVCVGQGMLELWLAVEQHWVAVQQAASLVGGETLAALQAGGGLPHAVHLFEATANLTERLGWYVAGDVQVLNAECGEWGGAVAVRLEEAGCLAASVALF